MPFWDSIANLFRQAEASSATAPTIHELIERTPAELTDYDRWLRTTGSRRLLDWLDEQYAAFRAGRPTDESIGFLKTDSTNGFVVYVHQMNYTREEITHFFDFLRERILTLNYRADISDRRIFPRRDWVETRERHYLKPRVNYDDEVFNQGFGNITVELELRNDVPHNLRLRATVYSDAMYKDGASFAGLITALTAE